MSDLVKGSVLFFNLYDVAEEIKLDRVRELLGARPQERVFKHARVRPLRAAASRRKHRGQSLVASTGHRTGDAVSGNG